MGFHLAKKPYLYRLLLLCNVGHLKYLICKPQVIKQINIKDCFFLNAQFAFDKMAMTKKF
jgi:hypothetical protein